MNMTNTAENRRIVQEGLQRRTDRLNAFENDMINAVHQNCTTARVLREKEEASHTAKAISEEERKAKARARLKAMNEAHKQEREVSKALNAYMVTVVVLLLLAAGTQFPYWASITLAMGLAVILAVHLYRIFVPLESEAAR